MLNLLILIAVVLAAVYAPWILLVAAWILSLAIAHEVGDMHSREGPTVVSVLAALWTIIFGVVPFGFFIYVAIQIVQGS